MNQQILEAIDQEIARLRQVRAVLANQKTAVRGKQGNSVADAEGPRRHLSAKARHAIAEAQRRRWERVHSLKKDVGSVVEVNKETAVG